MGSTEVLSETVHRTREELADRLEVLRTQFGPDDPDGPSRSRRGCPPIDEFVTKASRHLHAVNEVLLPAARSELPDGKQLAHAYLDSARVLEVVLAHVKAHEYGSVYEGRFSWPAVWSEVGTALETYWDREEEVAERLTETLDDEVVDELAEQLREAEPEEPSRPHPYLPHTGALGAITRRVVRMTDRAWDHAEGRPLPLRARAARKRPGLMGQYLLGDPRMEDPAQEPTAEERDRG